MAFDHVEIDLETLGTLPGSVILSIGAVLFDPTKPVEECLGKEFYCVVSKADSLAHGMSFSQDTLDWWMKQSPEARQVLTDADSDEKADMLEDALGMLSQFITPNMKVWSNGANFDQPLLEVAYSKIGQPIPWKYYNSRCHRTVLSLHPAAKSQARHVVIVANALGLKL
jgi:hypothetical protein